ncbi:hypothetical protein [Methanooceanicella nereidis]|nr:hypothetical protein [Methanocella sp. CWC-04]
MSLDTYLPAGKGKYLIGSLPNGNGSLKRFYYFMPDDRTHVRIGFLIVGSGDYYTSDYLDVIVFQPEDSYEEVEYGSYTVVKPERYHRIVELCNEDCTKRYKVFEQPKLGRFRFMLV